MKNMKIIYLCEILCKAVDKTEMDLALMINKSIYSLNKNNSLFPLEETSLNDLLCKGLFFVSVLPGRKGLLQGFV